MSSEIDKLSRLDNKKQVFVWWNGRRKHYNISLVIAGIIAYIFFNIVYAFANEDLKPADDEFTILTIIFEGFFYLFMMGIANLCFFAGPLLEISSKPINVDQFRTVFYRTVCSPRTKQDRTKAAHKSHAQKSAQKGEQNPQIKVVKTIDLVESYPTTPVSAETDPSASSCEGFEVL